MQPVPLSKYRQWLDGEAVVYVPYMHVKQK